MSGIYKTTAGRLDDVLTANTSVYVRFETMSNGKVRFAPTTPFERAVALENQAQAITRLVIDDSMQTD